MISIFKEVEIKKKVNNKIKLIKILFFNDSVYRQINIVGRSCSSVTTKPLAGDLIARFTTCATLLNML